MKILPKAPFKSKEDAKTTNPKIQSCCHPTKVMFLGMVLPSDDHKDSDGKVMVKRV